MDYQEITDVTDNHALLASLIAASHPEYSRVVAVRWADPEAKPRVGIQFERQTEWGTMRAIFSIAAPLVANDELRNDMVELACRGVAGQFERGIAHQQAKAAE